MGEQKVPPYRNRLSLGYHLIDKAVFQGFLCRHEVIALAVCFNNGDILTGVFSEDPVQISLDFQDLLGLYLNIGTLTLAAAGRLVDHDFGIGKRKALALCTAREQECTH